jgi:UDP-3-O-[3-hydroxymyristoyl] glucosamine N-acyltransferase
MGLTLGFLAKHLGAELKGDADYCVDSVATLAQAKPHQLTFLSNAKYQSFLASSDAGVVILSPKDSVAWQGHALVVRNPYLAYAKAAALLHPMPVTLPSVHERALVADNASLAVSVTVDAGAVIQAGAVIGEGTFIGANSVIDRGVVIGNHCWIGPNVTILHDCVLGDEVMVESGTVIGSEGFGWAKDGERWVKVPQLGRVLIGDRVSIGANTCVDRGAIEDTVIEDGVKLDNLIQISHNVILGANTAMAGSSGIAGSTKVGEGCTIAGMVGVAGHLTIADDVHITAMTLVSHSLTEAGVYSGNVPVDVNAQWRKNVARFRQLDAMAKRLKRLEKRWEMQPEDA